MLGVVTRKTFWDFWDNIVVVFVGNLILVAVLLIVALAVEGSVRFGVGAVVLLLFFAVIVIGLLLAAFAVLLGGLIRRREFHRGAVLRAIAAMAPAAVFLAATTVGVVAGLGWIVFATHAGPTVGGVMIILAVAWILGVWLQVALFALSARATAVDDMLTALRQAAVLVFDNPVFCLVISGFAVVLLAFTLIIVPGPGAVLILFDNALTLRRRKYASQGPADWDTLLAEEKRALARRTPRSILFPWRS